MKTLTRKAFETFVLRQGPTPDLSDTTFERYLGKTHNWQNYILEVVRQNWTCLSDFERRLIWIVAEEIASKEDWD